MGKHRWNEPLITCTIARPAAKAAVEGGAPDRSVLRELRPASSVDTTGLRKYSRSRTKFDPVFSGKLDQSNALDENTARLSTQRNEDGSDRGESRRPIGPRGALLRRPRQPVLAHHVRIGRHPGTTQLRRRSADAGVWDRHDRSGEAPDARTR